MTTHMPGHRASEHAHAIVGKSTTDASGYLYDWLWYAPLLQPQLQRLSVVLPLSSTRPLRSDLLDAITD